MYFAISVRNLAPHYKKQSYFSDSVDRGSHVISTSSRLGLGYPSIYSYADSSFISIFSPSYENLHFNVRLF
jgi:hypothetical protein